MFSQRKNIYKNVVKNSFLLQIIQSSLKWLDEWEKLKIDKKITDDEFLTDITAHNLRLSLHSTIDLCDYLINNYGFKYVLTGKLNQDNLEVS